MSEIKLGTRRLLAIHGVKFCNSLSKRSEKRYPQLFASVAVRKFYHAQG